MGSISLTLIVVDTLLRRLVLPLVLLTAVVFRYNLFSLVYLLLFAIALVLPSPRLKSQKYATLLFLILQVIMSLLFLLAQVFFQFTLIKEQFIDCSPTETVLREIGLVQFDIPVLDVLRLLLPDLVVLVPSVAALIVTIYILRAYRKLEQSLPGTGSERVEGMLAEEGEAKVEETALQEERQEDVSGGEGPPFPASVQSYWQVPLPLSFILELLIFLLLGLSGIAVPSLTSLVYFLSSLLLLIIWSLHSKAAALIRVLRLCLVFYAIVHLVVLYLYQFPSAQFHIPLSPNGTTTSLLARLFGLTPLITNDCSHPTMVLLTPGLNFVHYINPFLLLSLLWVLATDFRLWLSTPTVIWGKYHKYFIPITDHALSPPSFLCVVVGKVTPSVSLYGSLEKDGMVRMLEVGAYKRPSVVPRRLLDAWHKMTDALVSLWSLCSSISYILAIIAMMAWSMISPSWTSVVFLIWACVIWLFPKVNPRQALFWTSPILVIYTFFLLLLQYCYSLDIGNDELHRNEDLISDCEGGLQDGCKSLSLLVKGCFTLVFFTAFREFVLIVQVLWREWRRGREQNCTDETTNVPVSSGTESPVQDGERVRLTYEGLRQLVGTYWILMVIAAFLLVVIMGDPGLLKTVYLLFFFYFMITYQLTEHWFPLNFLVWWFLIVYSVLHLLVVYTYNFDLIRSGWTQLYNITGLEAHNVSETDLYTSVGLQRYDNTFRSLFSTLVPPAIFVAVLAMQLRYFKPSRPTEHTPPPLQLSSFMPNFVRNALKNIDLAGIAEEGDGEEEEVWEEEVARKDSEGPDTAAGPDAPASPPGLIEPAPLEEGEDEGKRKRSRFLKMRHKEASVRSAEECEEWRAEKKASNSSNRKSFTKSFRQPTLRRQSTILSPTQSCVYSCFKFFAYLFNKSRMLLLELIILSWRFLELHLHKLIVVLLFVISLSHISVLYWFLLLVLVVMVPLPYFNRLSFPLMTFYLGVVTIIKTIYQLPVILEIYFEFPSFNSPLSNCSSEKVGNDSGQVFMHRFAPQGSDAKWIGLHKVGDEFARYISLPIIGTLMMTLWFSARRYQTLYRHSKGITVSEFERGSLFLNVPRADAEKALWPAFKYWVNHFFEIYGIELCWCMLAATVAVRIDIYGVFFALSLGLLLVVPRKVVFPFWIGYLIVHGMLLVVQYFFLMGIPSGYCLTNSGEVYPWSSFSSRITYPVSLKRWLFLPADQDQILSRNLLYADFLVYVLVCLQATNFLNNPLRAASSDHYRLPADVLDFIKCKYVLDYFKHIFFQYFFWVSIFLIFVTAVARVSFLGVVYLIALFFFLYRGQEMLKDRKSKRHISWALLRWFSWMILLLRVCLQCMACVFFEDDKLGECTAIILFNGACSSHFYYGIVERQCEASNIGLWVDAFNFGVITLQIIVMDACYTETIRESLIESGINAAKFRDVFDQKVEEKQTAATNERMEELKDLRRRAGELEVTGRSVDHVLRRGVRMPKDIELKHSWEVADSSDKRKKDTYFEMDQLSPHPKSKTTDQSDETDGTDEEEGEKDLEGKLSQAWNWVVKITILIVDQFTEWLEERSALYREVVQAVQECNSASEHSESILSQGNAPVGVEDSEQQQQQDVHVSVSSGDEVKPKGKEAASGNEVSLKETPRISNGNSEPGASYNFDHRGNILETQLHLGPSESTRRITESYEADIRDKASVYTRRVSRLFKALYYMFLSHSEYVAYFLLILNIILNGSVLSLIFAVLLYGWGLLSTPWPSKRFWLVLIFYSMTMLVIKYCFQFRNIDWWSKYFVKGNGLYLPRVIGIEFRTHFLNNATWDMLLLIALLIHRGLLKQYGLWRNEGKFSISNIWSRFLLEFKLFFKRLVDPKISLGNKDYYVSMLICDILCFLTIAFGVNSFGVGTGEDLAAVANFIQSNRIPIAFLVMLLLQFISMLVDRAIYLRHSLLAKIIFQISLLLIWHAWLFFILPSVEVTNRPFTHNTAAQFLYFFKSCYFIISSLQIVAGYPTRVISNFLATKYTDVSYVAFSVYRLIPLLPELREVMDWVFTDTTLSLLNWLKVQEIYAQLYLVKVRREREKNYPRDLGQKQGLLTKIGLGAVLLSALVLLIWGPLLFISLVSNASPPNSPTEINVRLNLAGFEPLVHLTAQNVSITKLNADQYVRLTQYFMKNSDVNLGPLFKQQLTSANFKRVKLTGDSTALWIISPPARSLLVQQLENVKRHAANIMLEFLWTISRDPSSGDIAETVSGSKSRILTYPKDNDTIDHLLSSLSSSESISMPVTLKELFPVVIQAPAASAATEFTELTRHLRNDEVRYISANVQLSKSGIENFTKEWWGITQNVTSNGYILGDGNNEDNDFIEMIIYSSNVAPALFRQVAGLGIGGLYLSVVLVIGRFIRGFISNLPSRLIIDEILYPEPLLKLCDDIFLLRESKEFSLEEIYVGKLFYIFRSPEKIVQLTEEPKLKRD